MLLSRLSEKVFGAETFPAICQGMKEQLRVKLTSKVREEGKLDGIANKRLRNRLTGAFGGSAHGDWS
jgi:hypothetical protein